MKERVRGNKNSVGICLKNMTFLSAILSCIYSLEITKSLFALTKSTKPLSLSNAIKLLSILFIYFYKYVEQKAGTHYAQIKFQCYLPTKFSFRLQTHQMI